MSTTRWSGLTVTVPDHSCPRCTLAHQQIKKPRTATARSAHPAATGVAQSWIGTIGAPALFSTCREGSFHTAWVENSMPAPRMVGARWPASASVGGRLSVRFRQPAAAIQLSSQANQAKWMAMSGERIIAPA